VKVEAVTVSAPGGLAPSSPRRYALVRNWLAIVQLVLATAVVYLYHIEDPTLFRVMLMATIGFAVSVVLPPPYRLTFFIFLSFAGVLVCLGSRDGVWLIALGLALIGICRLPVPVSYRVSAILVAAMLLALMRMKWSGAPWSSALWPVLGSMFMFRMILYLRATAAKRPGLGVQHALAYFFMLPNVAFALFPVVDYETFRRTYFDRAEREIYAQGLLWISRGLVHLIVYRLVDQYVVKSGDVLTLGDLVQWMLGSLLLYLRVSGQFHLAVGVLHMFGFRLPETNKLYYLAHGFTDLWRRMNIYWTSFMTELVFYPIYFRVKHLGSTRALALSTAVVFFATWILHSYQWFWLQGDFPIRLPDVLFWGILGILVFRSAAKEQRTPREPRTPERRWSWRNGLRAAGTFGTLCILWSLWSTDSLDRWLLIVRRGSNVDAAGMLLLAVVFMIVTLLGAYRAPSRIAETRWIAFIRSPVVRSLVGLGAFLMLALPAVRGTMPDYLARRVGSLQTAGSGMRELAAGRGYYEELDSKTPLAEEGMGCARALYRSVGRLRQDYVDFDFTPSLRLTARCWGAPLTFSTNSVGMRDKEYATVKPRNTLRVELLGPSISEGWGVSDGEAFPQLVEDRLNRDLVCAAYRHIEILNFSVSGYAVPQELALLEDRGFRFSPDIVILTVTMRARSLTAKYLSDVSQRNLAMPYEPVRALLMKAGLEGSASDGLPIPFQSWRSIARRFGIKPQIPTDESYTRGLRIADRVDTWAIHRFAEVAAAHNVRPIVLTLDVVEDDMTPAIAVRRTVQESGMPVIDMLGVYPETNRHALWAASWDAHPNAAGHRVIAESFYRELAPFIAAECQHPATE
jgi:lysophospholipase L1-like esterase/D-alanyl-lipoteichoic acid acyltransferase DltB (MBOAT superfamily)